MKTRIVLLISIIANILFIFYFGYMKITPNSSKKIVHNNANTFNERYYSFKILNGDISAFNAYEDYLLKNDRPLEILPYAIFLANKYQHPRAYSVVGLTLEDIGDLIDTSGIKGLNALDNFSKQYAIKYFSVARKKDEPNAINFFNRQVDNQYVK